MTNAAGATPRSEITLIGLGAMGHELARVLVKAGRRVTVWNRSPERARDLVAAGAEVARSPAEAIAASPITVVCLWDYGAADDVLAQPGVEEALSGKVIAQLTTGSAVEADQQAQWCEARGATFVAGGIMCYPRAIGAADTIILYSGSRPAFQEHADLLRILAPAQRHVGDRPSDAATVYTAAWCFYFAAMGGFFDGLALVAASGLGRDGVEAMIAPMAGKFVEGARDVLRRLESGNFSGDQATVAGHVDGLAATCAQVRQIGAEPWMLDAFVDQLSVALAQGRGEDDLAAVAASLESSAQASAEPHHAR